MEEKSEKIDYTPAPTNGRFWVQRDLEDQIREELEERARLNNNTNQQKMEPITTSGVLADLKSGKTRFKKDDKGYGSIEEKYGLTVDEVKELFKLDSLKARKTAEPKRKLEIIDDLAMPQGDVVATVLSPIIAQSQDVPEVGAVGTLNAAMNEDATLVKDQPAADTISIFA